MTRTEDRIDEIRRDINRTEERHAEKMAEYERKINETVTRYNQDRAQQDEDLFNETTKLANTTAQIDSASFDAIMHLDDWSVSIEALMPADAPTNCADLEALHPFQAPDYMETDYIGSSPHADGAKEFMWPSQHDLEQIGDPIPKIVAFHLKGDQGWGMTHIQVELESGIRSPWFGNDNPRTDREKTVRIDDITKVRRFEATTYSSQPWIENWKFIDERGNSLAYERFTRDGSKKSIEIPDDQYITGIYGRYYIDGDLKIINGLGFLTYYLE